MFVPDDANHELVKLILERSKLSPLGVRLLQHDLYWASQQRHKIAQGTLHEPVTNPVFITGTGRTASSFLHARMRDVGFRVANVFEATTLNRSNHQEMLTGHYFLVNDIKRMIERADEEVPEYALVNAHQWDDPAEDIHFERSNFGTTWWLPHYGGTLDWAMGRMFENPVADVEHLRSCAEVLGRPGNRWCFRATTHLMHLEALFEVFPDAHVIWMERPTDEVIPGLRKMIYGMRRTRSESVDMDEVDMLAESMATIGPACAETSIASGNIPVDQVIRVSFEDITENTDVTVHRILDRVAIPERSIHS